ncbi:hypothetical protein SMICM304S_10403 [Streptomyces microflavus]
MDPVRRGVREVPVCGADEARLSRGEDPMSRTVDVGDGNRRPYWEAGPAYGPWAGGFRRRPAPRPPGRHHARLDARHPGVRLRVRRR